MSKIQNAKFKIDEVEFTRINEVKKGMHVLSLNLELRNAQNLSFEQVYLELVERRR